MYLISKEVVLTLIAIYFFSNYNQKYHIFFVLLRAYKLSDNFMNYVNSILSPDYFKYNEFDESEESKELLKDNTDNKEVSKKYEDKYLEEIKKLNKEFTFDADEETIKLEKYIELIAILKANRLEICLDKLIEIEEKLIKYEKNEDDSEQDYCISNIEEEEYIEEQIKILIEEKTNIQFEYDKLKTYLDSDEGNQEIMKESLDLATKFIIDKKLEKLKNCYVMEKTPLGNVLMIYNIDKNSFSYYSDNAMPYRYLETVARKYVKTFACRPVFVDMDEELKKSEEIWELERIEKEKKDEEERKKIEELKSQNKTVEQKKSVFAKFKSYNKDSSAKKAMVAPPKNTVQNKKLTNEQENEKILLKDNANRYTYEGKLSNFNFLKKIEKKVVSKKYAMTFADFKNLQKNK